MFIALWPDHIVWFSVQRNKLVSPHFILVHEKAPCKFWLVFLFLIFSTPLLWLLLIWQVLRILAIFWRIKLLSLFALAQFFWLSAFCLFHLLLIFLTFQSLFFSSQIICVALYFWLNHWVVWTLVELALTLFKGLKLRIFMWISLKIPSIRINSKFLFFFLINQINAFNFIFQWWDW